MPAFFVQMGAMRWSDGFIAVDWGTTNRRAYRLDSAGNCVNQFEDDRGILAIEPDGFPAAAADIRKRLGDTPLLLAGMVGSTRGWVEAPYVDCPASLDQLAARLCWIEAENAAIVPGLALKADGRADVMRGEEIQLFGAMEAALVPSNCLVCHPGTHNKWVSLEEGRIASFRTVMTGEMFNLLRGHGMLAEFLSGDARDDCSFREGVRKGLDFPALTAELFSVRARVLLGGMAREDAPSYVSGLLIGIDIGVGRAMAGHSPIVIMGRPELTSLYAAGALEAGLEAAVVDGASAFVAGAAAVARSMA